MLALGLLLSECKTLRRGNLDLPIGVHAGIIMALISNAHLQVFHPLDDLFSGGVHGLLAGLNGVLIALTSVLLVLAYNLWRGRRQSQNSE